MAGTQDDKTIGKNLQILRGDISQEDLASKMRGYGFKWSKATVWSVEQGERPLRLTEAKAVLQCLGRRSMFAMNELLSISSYAYAEKLRDQIQEQINEIIDLLDKIYMERLNLAGNADLLIEHEEIGRAEESAIAEDLRRSLPENIFKEYLFHELKTAESEDFEQEFYDKYSYEEMTKAYSDALFKARSEKIPKEQRLRGGTFIDALHDDKRLKELADTPLPQRKQDK